MKRLTLVLVTVACYLAANAQIMQRSSIKGLNVAAGINMVGWSSEYYEFLSETAGSGYGAGLTASYGITELIEPYVGFSYSAIGTGEVDAESMSMGQLDIGARLNFLGTIHAWRPFVQAGYSNQVLGLNGVNNGDGTVDVRIKSHAPHVGGGVAYFFNPVWSVYAKGLFTLEGKTSEFFAGEKIDAEPDITAFRVTLGAKFNLQSLIY
ncbi:MULTISPECIES: outer membrane beta-barrel protein [Parapedobacter]|uniref:outer membrane beta-barrel protein n=1 Tax=Parapedobacter TaxID=416949 RepID=UPI00333F1A4B